MFSKKVDLKNFKDSDYEGYFIVQEDDSMKDALSEICYLVSKSQAEIELRKLKADYPDTLFKMFHIKISEA